MFCIFLKKCYSCMLYFFSFILNQTYFFFSLLFLLLSLSFLFQFSPFVTFIIQLFKTFCKIFALHNKITT